MGIIGKIKKELLERIMEIFKSIMYSCLAMKLCFVKEIAKAGYIENVQV